jgi:hypothetical protein
MDIIAKLFIDFSDGFLCVEEHQNHIGSADAPLRAMDAIEFDVAFDAFKTLHAGRVDGDEGSTVKFESDINAVTGRAGNLTHDHPFCLSE